MSSVSDRFALYRNHGLDVARDQVWGCLSPELIQALVRLVDLLVVSEVMEAPQILVKFEVV